MVPFGEIVANPSDLKHVVELLGCSDGLGMVILAGKRRGIVFKRALPKSYSGVERRLVD